MKKQLIYVHDPMCSWCWGFEPTRRKLFSAIAGKIPVRRLVGGLAPDSDEPMPESMQNMLRQTWRRIELTIPGTRFNYEFWDKCKPRRSTYPANRAVLAAREQGEEFDPLMTARIQQAYYLEARNPSDISTLIELAAEIGLDADRFAELLVSESLQQGLLAEIQQARAMGIDSFPSLAVARAGATHPVKLNYTDARAMLQQIEAA
ncbi:MAG: DsbA family protein [Gammaproteobacteria bacterium]|nr:DsbA family protein [Gammaproteobacteria bacterium]MDH3448685.1 DsbA family protein [Gammaproteobacteria bacterium]